MEKHTENNLINQSSIASANSPLEEESNLATESLVPPQLSLSAHSKLPISRKESKASFLKNSNSNHESVDTDGAIDSAKDSIPIVQQQKTAIPKEESKEEVQETNNEQLTFDSPSVSETNLQLKVAPSVDTSNLIQQQKTALPKEESKEEVQETTSIQLAFDTSSPIEPNDESGNDGAASGNSGDGSSGNPIQKKDPSGTPAAGSTSGNNMPPELQSKMEASMGADFSDVNIHTNSSSATDVNALAFAQGNDVHFAPGQYDPSSQSGQQLLGHELAHIVQQREGRVKPTTSVNGMAVNNDQSLEKEADILGVKAASAAIPVQKKSKFSNPKDLGSATQLMQRKIAQLNAVLQMTPNEENQVQQLIDRGSRNENYLTNVIFYIRHPERDGDRLEFPSQEPQEMALVSEWIEIRNTIVRPLLNASPAPTPTPEPSTPSDAADTSDPNGATGNPQDGTPAPAPAPAPAPDSNNGTSVPTSDSSNASSGNNANANSPESGVDWDKFWSDNGLNIARTVLEPFRLIPAYGIIPGMAADVLETISDLDAAKPTHDQFIEMLILIRMPVVLANNVVGHLLYIDELAQDIATGSVIGVELDILTAPAAEALGALRTGILTVQTVIDAMVVAKSIMGMNDVESTPAERDAYRSVFFGYDANLIMDGIDFITTGLDMASAGFANGTAIGQFVKVGKKIFDRKSLFTKLVQNVIQSWVGVWGGDIESGIDKAVNGEPAQNKMENSEDPIQSKMDSVGGVSREIAAQIILAELNQIEGAYNLGTTVIDAHANQLQFVMDNIDDLSQHLTDQDAIPALRDAMLAGLDHMTGKLNGIMMTQPFITSAAQKAALIRGYLDEAQAAIDSIQIPNIEVPDVPFVPEFLENAAEGGMNLIIDNLNTAVNQVKEMGTAAITALREKSEEIGEFLHILSQVLADQIEFITEKIGEFRNLIASIDSLEDIGDMMLGQISEMLGIDPPLTVERLREGWAELNSTIRGGFDLAREMVNTEVRGEPSQGKFIDNPSQMKEGLPNNNTEASFPPDENVMQKMEQSFGTSFADVNIHENSTTAKDAGALAYAQGTDIHFAPGQFKPETQSGQQLLGHELAHVVQQKQGRVKATGSINGMALNTDQSLENEADVLGTKAAQFKLKDGNLNLTKNSNDQSPLADIAQPKVVQPTSSIIQRTAPIIRRGSTTVGPPTDNNYNITGSYRDITNRLAGPEEDGSITTNISDYSQQTNEAGTEITISITVSIVKSMPNWTDFPQIVTLSQDESLSPQQKSYYQRIVTVWNAFMASLNAHEEEHKRIDIAGYTNLHRQLIGKTSEEADAKITEIETAINQLHEDFHADARSAIMALPYIQRPAERRAPGQTSPDDVVQYNLGQNSSPTSNTIVPYKHGFLPPNIENEPPIQGFIPLLIAGAAAFGIGFGAGYTYANSNSERHTERNQHNQLPTGILRKESDGSAGIYDYDDGGDNNYVDDAGRVWVQMSEGESVYHQPKEIVDGAIDYQWQSFAAWWNDEELGDLPNKKFISRDDQGGSFEAVLQPNEDGTYTNNWLNSGTQQGTYNYSSPDSFGGKIGHFVDDVLPHYLNEDYGSTPTQQKSEDTPIQKKDDAFPIQVSQNIVQLDGDGSSSEGDLALTFPFGIAEARTNTRAAFAFFQFQGFIDGLKTEIDEEERYSADTSDLAEASRQITGTVRNLAGREEGSSLERGEVLILQPFINGYKETYDNSLRGYREFVLRNVRQSSRTQEIDPMTPELAEAKRQAYENGDDDQLQRIQDLIGSIKTYNEKISTYISYASRVSSAIRGSATLQAIQSTTGSIAEYAGKAGDIVNAMRIIANFATDSSNSELHNSINRVQAELDTIDVVMTFAKGVPVLGFLWSNYYYPAATACLQMIGRIASVRNRERRLLTWISNNWHSPTPPSIESSMSVAFPGGQSVFSFLWHLFFGNYQFSSAAEEYFMDHETDINAGTSRNMVITGAWNPFVDNHIESFQYWADTNKMDLWLMFYGADLPFPGTGSVEQTMGEYNDAAAQRSVGQPMQRQSTNDGTIPEGLQSSIESNIGMSMSNVNIHTNSSKASELGALAFSQGSDISFAPGQFNPGTKEGDHLIAHEAAHLTQKSGLKPTTEVNGTPVNDDRGLESEADSIADKIVQKKEDSFNLKPESSFNKISDSSNSINQFQIDNSIVPNSKPNLNSTRNAFSLSSGREQNNTIQNKQDKAFSLNTPSSSKSVSSKNEASNQFSVPPLKSESHSKTDIKQFMIASNAGKGKNSTPSQDAPASADQDVNMAELRAVQYELVAHGLAYTTALNGEQNSLIQSWGYMPDWFGGPIDHNRETGFFAGMLMPNLKTNESKQASSIEDQVTSNVHPILAFRGSETSADPSESFQMDQFLRDWLYNDMDPTAVGYTAFMMHQDEVRAKLMEAIQLTGKKVIVTGHSLGGSLAKQTALMFPQFVQSCYTYQAPGISAQQQEYLEQNGDTQTNAFGEELSEEDRMFLEQNLDNPEDAKATLRDIHFESHTSEGDIVHNAGGGRVPWADRIQHDPSGMLEGNSPLAHTLYLTNADQYSEEHEVLRRLLEQQTGNATTDGNDLYEHASQDLGDEQTTLGTSQDAYRTDSQTHEMMDRLKNSLISEMFNPQANLIMQYPQYINQMPIGAKIQIMSTLLNGPGVLESVGKGVAIGVAINSIIVNPGLALGALAGGFAAFTETDDSAAAGLAGAATGAAVGSAALGPLSLLASPVTLPLGLAAGTTAAFAYSVFAISNDMNTTQQAVMVLLNNSSPDHQAAMVRANGGAIVFYERMDTILNGLFNNNFEEIRNSLRREGGYFASLSTNEGNQIVRQNLNSGIAGFGDDTEEKLIADVLLFNSNGRSIITEVGNGDYNEGLETILRKLQGQEDDDVSRRYHFTDSRWRILW